MKIFKDCFKEKQFSLNNIVCLEDWGEIFQILEKPLHKLEENQKFIIFFCIFCFIQKKKYSLEAFSKKLKKKIDKSKLRDFCKEFSNFEKMPIFFEENSILLEENRICNICKGVLIEGILSPPNNISK